MIPKRELIREASYHNLSPHVIEKDYVIGWILSAIINNPNLAQEWVFKGGTCLKKCYFDEYMPRIYQKKNYHHGFENKLVTLHYNSLALLVEKFPNKNLRIFFGFHAPPLLFFHSNETSR